MTEMVLLNQAGHIMKIIQHNIPGRKPMFTRSIFVAQLGAMSCTRFKHVRNSCVIAAIKSQVLYTRDTAVVTQSATKIPSSCATKIACVNEH